MIRSAWCFFVAAVWTLVLFPWALLTIIFTFSGRASGWMARRLWAPVLLATGGAKVIVHGRENIDFSKPAIYVSNHQSTIDIPATFVAIPVNLVFVAKKQLAWVPIMGWYIAIAGY